VFRQLRQRLTGVAYALLLGCGLLLLQAPTPVMAAEIGSCPLPQEDPRGPEAARLLKQPLSSQAAQQSIEQLLDAPPFENRETVTLWRFGEDATAENPGEDSLKELIEKFLKLTEFWKNLDAVALFFEALLWAALFALVALLVWRYRDWLAAFSGRLGLPQRRPQAPPSQLFGLEVAPESLPEDVAGEVERLWAEQPRAALGLLYRALLSRLLHDYRLPLKSAHTEAEVLHLVQGLDRVELSDFSQLLTRHWQNLAYGHRLPPDDLQRALCNDWRRLSAAGGRG
jgi:hypothetical protein